MDKTIEYELIDIEFEFGYEMPEEEGCFVHDDGPEDQSAPQIEYDADGIPMGSSMEEIRKREQMIKEFLEKWGNEHPERCIFNEKLEDYIYVRGISVIEAKEHSAKSYNSTLAVLKILDEVLSNASPIKRVSKKGDDRNQKDFSYFLVMIYKHQEIGSIKLTIGVKKNFKKIQYGISALKPDEPLVDYSEFKKSKKKRNPHK